MSKKNVKIIFIFFLALTIVLPVNISRAEGNINILDIESVNAGSGTVKIRWITDADTHGKVLFGKEKDDLPHFIVESSGLARAHEVELANLESEQTYYYRIVAYNDLEETASFINHFKTVKAVNPAPPILSRVRIPYAAGTLAVVEWETDKEANSRLEYDSVGTYGKTAKSDTKTTSHRIILKNLSPATTYSVRAYSIGKDNGRSSEHYKSFTTLASDSVDRDDLMISYLRPSGPDDSHISPRQIFVGFKTNHYARGKITLKRSGKRALSRDLDYALDHSAIFTGLEEGADYVLEISLTDVFGKKAEIKDYAVKTGRAAEASPAAISGVSGGIITAGWEGESCQAEIMNLSGYYGEYFNLPKSVATRKISGAAGKTGWYDAQYLSFSRVDSHLDFGDKFFPLDEGLDGDPYYFAVRWQAVVEVPVAGTYSYEMISDDDSWIFIDDRLMSALDGCHSAKKRDGSVSLETGFHYIDIYFAERKPKGSYFSLAFTSANAVRVYPRMNGCIFDPASFGRKQNGYAASGTDGENMLVLGAEYSRYTPAAALYKTPDSPDIYAIVNGQRHYISSPASFAEYGYDWKNIKTVSRAELEQYPRARLIKQPDSGTVYYLYQRPENQWQKIAIPSPTVFISYPGNYWGNVITVTRLDVDSYPDVKLIRGEGDAKTYYLGNGVKRPISAEAMNGLNLSVPEIAEVNKIHLDTYKSGPAM